MRKRTKLRLAVLGGMMAGTLAAAWLLDALEAVARWMLMNWFLLDEGHAAAQAPAMSGVLIIMVMRMLAEMAVASPSTGSFADYSRNAMGNWAGFSVGWLYWYFWVIVVGFEAIAGAKIIQYWVDVPIWLTALILLDAAGAPTPEELERLFLMLA